MSPLKGNVSQDFRPSFFHDLNPSGPLRNRPKYFRILFWFRQDIQSRSSKNSTPQCAWHQGVNILGLANQIFFLEIFSFMIDVVTPKRISPNCPFTVKATRDAQRFWFWLRVVQFDSAVWCALRSLTPRCDAHPWSLTPQYYAHIGAQLRSVMHTAKLDSEERCTLWSQTT